MRKFTGIVVFCVVMAAALLLSACNSEEGHALKGRVLVIHSWSDIAEDGVLFPQIMEEAFRQEEIDATVRHMYIDMVRRSGEISYGNAWKQYEDSILEWKPDIILVNDDPILEQILVRHISDTIFQRTPVVFAGINVLHRDSLYRYPLMTGFVDQIDLGRNIELMMKITKQQALSIELDYTLHDRLLREELYAELSDSTRYVNNSDFHVNSLDSQYLKNRYPGQAIVSFVSCAEPEKNQRPNENISGKQILGRYYAEAKRQWHLQVKRDIFSHNIIDHSRRPQFTCIREQFNNPKRVRFLCGYFTSTETQVYDQVRYATEILRGVQPKTLPIGIHKQGYYMDYNAMVRFTPALKYEDYADSFTIVNAPYKYENPKTTAMTLILGVALVCGIAVIIVHTLFRWKKKGSKDLFDELMYEDKVSKLLFTKKSDTVWHLKDNIMYITDEFAAAFGLPSAEFTIEQLWSMVDEWSAWSLNTLLDFRNQRGRKSVRMHVTPDQGKRYFWIEVLYEATEETARTGELYGILLNIDEKKATEDQLTEAQRKSSEVALKETFLANISHDLRTPLNAINGFSELLTSEEMEVTAEDRQVFNDMINQNTEMILKMIDNIVEKSQLESGDIVLIKQKKSVTELIQESYLTNKVIAPAHLRFRMENDSNDCDIDIDVTRTKQIINNFLSNAFKFTIEGGVTLGWKHVKRTEYVEIYVRDTGIGVSKEKQAHLFDRFYKENENARGTGLGLDISKTIIDNMGGEIGVKSEKGKGSTFYIRMKRHIMTWIALICSISCGLSSCSLMNNDATHKHIVLIHSFDKGVKNYEILNRNLESTLESEKIDADICHIYLGINGNEKKGKPIVKHAFDSLSAIGWEPNIILADGDRTMRDMMSYIDSIDVFSRVPIVIFALHHPNWDFIRSHNQIVPICEPIDYCKNINLAVEMTGINMVDIELDYFYQDSINREDLRAAIARPPYIDNSDFHVFRFGQKLENAEEWKDSIIVTTISAESPERNVPPHETATVANEYNAYTYLWDNPSLAIKNDLYSFDIIDKTKRPQFTAIKSGFAEGGGERFLCGYFASYETVAHELGVACSKLLRGADARSMTGLMHHQEYHMNYMAMKALGYKYDDYKDKFNIIGAPFKQVHPWLYIAFWILGIVFIAGIATVASWLAVRWRDKGQNALISNIMHKAKIRKLALRGAASRSVKSKDELKEIIAHIHPDHTDIATEIELSAENIGEYIHEIYIDLETPGDYKWWQLRHVVMLDKKGKKRIDGILFSIDETKKYEEDLRIANKLAEEARQKEDFLKTISHEIRTPLNAVVGFSDILASEQVNELSEEEIIYLKNVIKENNDKLRSMIDDVLLFSRVESGSINYNIEDIELSEMIEEIGAEWSGKAPEGVRFIVMNYFKDLYIKSDKRRLRYIIDQMASNAIKFTKEGTIMIGYHYDFNAETATIIVEDTGCGLSKEKQKAVFDLFWKNDNFIPGLGLGLNIAQKLAKDMGANITLRSKEGQGSTFLITMKGEIRKNDC
ncbi:MAG: HAMP domain-containing histidine kinase [Bacteroidales bacterium]|nr:HAMP domain-containing histidine kinase [Bacteroidales bacterium]